MFSYGGRGLIGRQRSTTTGWQCTSGTLSPKPSARCPVLASFRLVSGVVASGTHWKEGAVLAVLGPLAWQVPQ